MRTQNRRTPISLALLAAAALAATSGCTVAKLSSSSLKDPSTVFVLTGKDDLGNWVCTVTPEHVIIDTAGGSNYAKQVTWIRFGDDRAPVRFSLKDPNQGSIMPKLEGLIPEHVRDRRSGEANVSSGGVVVGYKVAWRSATCDPDICIRKSGAGCEGYLER